MFVSITVSLATARMEGGETMTEKQRLQQEATRILRKAGFTWSGRPKKDVAPEQCALERMPIRVPFGGLPTYKR
jgi:hypothetical protein